MIQERLFRPTKISQKDRILKLLQSKKIVTMRELNAIAFRYSARLYDLRKEGYNIGEQRKKGNLWVYFLIK